MEIKMIKDINDKLNKEIRIKRKEIKRRAKRK
jgi:hypothetical protein